MKYLSKSPIVFGYGKGEWPFPCPHVAKWDGEKTVCHRCKAELVRDGEGWKVKEK